MAQTSATQPHPSTRPTVFKTIRIAVLLLILLVVAVGTWRTKVNSVKWQYTLPVNVYPINADGQEATQAYIQTLNAAHFKPIEAFMQAEARRHGQGSKASIEIRLGQQIVGKPPMPPEHGGALSVAAWSLRMRWWAWRHGETTGPKLQVKIYLLYFDPAHSPRLSHSTALQKGLIGLARVFASADMAAQNNVIIAHEFLHTLGATDKYDRATDQPDFPDGYAEPEREPLFPQRFAEIMGGRLPLSQTTSETPSGLQRALIGDKTAQEINWSPAGQ